MSTTPAFSSNISEYRWVDQLSNHFIIYINNRPSIFRVPKSVCDTNPEAYAPQQIGIGAYHHFRPDLVEMDSRKVEAVKKFLEKNKGQYEKFKRLIVDKVEALEPSIRSCYNKYLDLDGDTLAWIMAIDGVYLLHLLSTYSGKKNIHFDDRDLAQDIFMMENQLPCFVLKEIKKAVKEIEKASQPPDEEDKDEDEDEDEDEVKVEIKDNNVEDDKELFSEMLSFCKAHTPLDLTENRQFVCDTTSPHLLSYMYSLIMHNWPTGKISTRMAAEMTDKFIQAARLLGDVTGQKCLMFLANLPLQQFFDLSKKDNPTANSSIEEIKIPSASQLHKVCKVQFQVWPDSGNGVKYLEEYRTLFLPMIRLNTDSEVILRNLVAYEVSSGSNNVVSGFVDFMCGLIDTVQDVNLLKEKGIIKSDLPNEEIAKIFNGISKSNRMRTDLEGTTQKLNEVYERRFTSKVWRFIKDHFVPSEASVKFFLAILVLLLLTLQAFCQVYGCSAHWFGSFGKINSIFDSFQKSKLLESHESDELLWGKK